MHDMRGARQEEFQRAWSHITSHHLKVTVPCGSAIFKGEGASGGPLHTQFICKKVKIDGKQP